MSRCPARCNRRGVRRCPGIQKKALPFRVERLFLSDATANVMLHLDRAAFANEICIKKLRGRTCLFFS